jgi:hypothetical protein
MRRVRIIVAVEKQQALLIGLCMHVGTRARGLVIRIRACSLAYPA